SISPVQGPSVTAGSAVSFKVTVTDKDSSACSSANFNLAGSVPSGWSAVLGGSMLTLTPGASGSTTLQVTSPSGTASGFYNLGVIATDAAAASYTGSGAATYVISTPSSLSLSVSTNQSSYSPGQWVYINVTVLAGTSPDAGVGVNANITTPSGSVLAALSGTTGSNGVATLKYRLKRQAAAGNYTATGSAASSGNAATVGGTTTFYVQ